MVSCDRKTVDRTKESWRKDAGQEGLLSEVKAKLVKFCIVFESDTS